MHNYISYRAFEETQKQIKEETLRKVATMLLLVEDAEDPDTQAAIFDEFDLDPDTFSLEDWVLLEELTGIEFF
jgi:hypothetical protein